MAGGLLVGYTIVIACFLVATMGIASAAPNFAVEQYRIRNAYKLVQALLWLVCTFAGAFAAALLIDGIYPVISASLLAAGLIAVLWRNSWEARQRGLPHQLLMSAMSAAGVALGFVTAYELFLKPGAS
jgi:hypothetical protein